MSKHDPSESENCRVCPDCTHVKENKKPCKRLKWKYSMNKWVFLLVGIVCVVGLIVPFWGQYAAPDEWRLKTALDVWNQYVGIVLGVVATLLSIVSLVFSFHNEEEENIQQRNYDKQFEDIKRTLHAIENSVDTTQTTMYKMNDQLIQMDKVVSSIKENQNNTTVESKPTKTTINTDSMN